jgi:hypothetical protein
VRSLADLMALHRLRFALEGVAHHVGGDADHPETVVQAAHSLRMALARALGHRDIPRTVDGHPAAFTVVGR